MAKNDELIKELLGKVEDQTAALGKKPRGTWVTNGVFKYSQNPNDSFNINVVTDFSHFAHALGILLLKKEFFERACKVLGITATFKWDGYTVDEYEEDFKMRISVVEYDTRKRQLEATKQKLQGLVSDEAKTEMALTDIAKSLGL